jgi:hypothetical protein
VNTTSSPILRLIERSLAEGNSVVEVSDGWQRVRQVTHMAADISDTLWLETQRQEPLLRCWSAEGTPHNAAERGFTDDEASVAIAFPRGAGSVR